MDIVRKLIREMLSEVMDKTSSYTSFLSAKNNLDKPNLYLHFSDIYKLGINPNKSHDDPHAIYFYPVKWILDENNWDAFQYAVTMNYFFLAQVDTGNFCDIPSLTMSKIGGIMKKVGIYDIWNEYESDFSSSPPRKFWEFLDMLNVNPSDRNNPNHHDLPQVKWNKFWSASGYDGFSDDKGVVNRGEPHQIAVFDQSKIHVIDSGENIVSENSSQAFFNEVIDTFNISVDKKGYEENGKYYRIIGSSNNKGLDIRIYPSDLMATVYYSDENGGVYKIQTENTFEPKDARSKIMSAIDTSIKKSGSKTVNIAKVDTIKNAANSIFNNFSELNIRSFRNEPVEFFKRKEEVNDYLFSGKISFIDKMVVNIKFSVSKEVLLGDPIDIYATIIDGDPGGNEETWKKELESYGISSATFKYNNAETIEDPVFNVNMFVDSPELALDKINKDLEVWINSYKWPKGDPNARLKFKRVDVSQKVMGWFNTNVKKV